MRGRRIERALRRWATSSAFNAPRAWMNKLKGRGKLPGQVVIAVARDRAGFIWAIARQEVLLASGETV